VWLSFIKPVGYELLNRCWPVALLLSVLMPPMVAGQSTAQLTQARRRMVDEAIIGAGVRDRRVIDAMLNTPRHEFVRASQRQQAYFDMSLPIGNQQTISSPFTVAFMTECIDPQPTDRVLEIGTGSGYQAAVLSPLVERVYTIEIVEPLGLRAERTLARLNYENVVTKVGDGFQGWAEHAPFDKIIVTCSPEDVPQPLVDQLKDDGVMVIPTGERYQQTLYLMRKVDGKLTAESLRPTLFVPMTGTAEENRRLRPDPTKPSAENGGFELPPGENGFLPGWYYQRQLTWVSDKDAPQGQHFVTFHNEQAGRPAHLLQGVPMDGRVVREIEVAGHVRYKDLRFSLRDGSTPMIALTFYDEQRKNLGHVMVGPFRNDSGWKRVSKSFRVPTRVREAILRIGLFGATGEISFDEVSVTARPR
jgi:protein-L-isoaspartate(D-aspartate) O-methyltransferase